jgi:hypothetical protein
LPGCGEPATERIEVYGADSLDAAAYACSRHRARVVAAIEAGGLAAYPVPPVPGMRRPCGYVHRYPTGGLADPPGDPHPQWCDRGGCVDRRRHRSVRLPLSPPWPEATRADVALAQALAPGGEPMLAIAVGGAEPGELVLSLGQGRVLAYQVRRLLNLAATRPRNQRPPR